MRTAALIVSLTAAVSAVTLAPGGANAATATGGPLCELPKSGSTVVQVTTADNGRRLCLDRGQRLSVVLSVDPQQYPDPANWWTPVTLTGTSLSRLPSTELPVRGTTLAAFLAESRGRSVLSSTWNPCPPDSPVVCGAPVHLWRVSVFVR